MIKEIAINTFWLLIIVLCCSLIASIIITPITNLRETKRKAKEFDNIINSLFVDRLWEQNRKDVPYRNTKWE